MVEQGLQLLLHVCDFDESYCDSSIQIVFAVFISYNLAPKFESFIVLILCRIFAYHTVSMLEQSNQKLLEQYGVEAISQFAQVNRERLTRLAQIAFAYISIFHFRLKKQAKLLITKKTVI